MDEMNQLSLPSRLLRYFVHGVAFSILFLFLAFVWIFIFTFLIVFGSIIGFIIGFVLLFFVTGGLNTFLTRWIWSADIRSGWLSLLIHGLGLFFALLIASIPSLLLIGTSYSLTLSIVLFVPYALLDGFIAKHVAFAFREDSAPLFSETNIPPKEPPDQYSATEYRTRTTQEPSENEAADAEGLYDKLLAKYVNHWGYQAGTRMLNEEIEAHTRHGDSFAEAVRKVGQRQPDD
jgi:hypothetical protein